jgi:hypothetical protein
VAAAEQQYHGDDDDGCERSLARFLRGAKNHLRMSFGGFKRPAPDRSGY